MTPLRGPLRIASASNVRECCARGQLRIERQAAGGIGELFR